VADGDWWRQAVVYQIYPRSFADADGDGIGDIRGIISRVPYLVALGIDAVWLSPFYPSPLADGGYDVADYRDIDPRLGTLADFDDLVSELHANGIRIIVDIVPNHTSEQHPWFQEALKAKPDSPARDRYIFRNGLGVAGDIPPSDWHSIFGGSAWQRVADGQWYLHTFAKEQPDLNWNNPEIAADFLTTLKFWADRGVDGFRVDVADALKKDLAMYPLPTWVAINHSRLWAPGQHPFRDREELLAIYQEWRALFNQYDPPLFAVAEAWVRPERAHRYAAKTSLGQVFNFDLLNANFDAAEFRQIITRNLANAAAVGSGNTWVLSNHDVVRHATRYGLPTDNSHNRQVARLWDLGAGKTIPLAATQGLRRARAASLLLLALPGSTYIYQGEELGLPHITGIPDDERQDPAFFRNREYEVGRDGCRIPIPWLAAAPSYGFSPTGKSHLRQPDSFRDYAVDVETANPNSTLNLYRRALALRRRLISELDPSKASGDELIWLDGEWLDDELPDDELPDDELPDNKLSHPDVLAFARPLENGRQWICVTNFGPSPMPLPAGDILLASNSVGSPESASRNWIAGQARNDVLPAETTIWVRR